MNLSVVRDGGCWCPVGGGVAGGGVFAAVAAGVLPLFVGCPFGGVIDGEMFDGGAFDGVVFDGGGGGSLVVGDGVAVAAGDWLAGGVIVAGGSDALVVGGGDAVYVAGGGWLVAGGVFVVGCDGLFAEETEEAGAAELELAGGLDAIFESFPTGEIPSRCGVVSESIPIKPLPAVRTVSLFTSSILVAWLFACSNAPLGRALSMASLE